MDGHAYHINFAASCFCRENNIILYCFPPHASHVIQPLDVSVYGPLKKHWNAALTDFAKRYRGLSMSRTHFFSVFDSAWKKSTANKQAAVSEFRKCGLVPYNPNAVDYERLLDFVMKTPSKRPAVDVTENVGMDRKFQLYEQCLNEDVRTLFSRRWV